MSAGIYSSTHSQSGKETGAPLQRIEALDVSPVGRARLNVAYTCATGKAGISPKTPTSSVPHRLAVDF